MTTASYFFSHFYLVISPIYLIFANMKRRILLISAWALLSLPSQAQQHETYNQRIATLQVVAGTDWLNMPVTQLNGEPINIDFDDLTHDYHRYTYKIEHCDADWSVSQELFESDYLQGFNGELVIDDINSSINTNHLYTHYHLAIPNENCRITMSGNYKINVYDDNADEDDKKMFTACFMVEESQVNVGIETTTSTDIDMQREHQQVRMTLSHPNLRLSHPNQIKTVVLQNGRWDNCITDARPDYTSDTQMDWKHIRQFIFPGGNEYRKFEFLDVDHPTMGIDDIRWDGKDYHVYLQTDAPRSNYTHDEVAQGAFYVRNSDNENNNTASDYAQVHFTLQAPHQQGEVYINANWTTDRFLPQYKMVYDASDHCYHLTLPMKQGYYSYQYLVLQPDGTSIPVSSEGNFYQTRNTYQALIYYRGISDRADRLVGFATTK